MTPADGSMAARSPERKFRHIPFPGQLVERLQHFHAYAEGEEPAFIGSGNSGYNAFII
jgi:hypothetical protein